MKLVQMSVRGISYSETQTGAYALILSEDEGERKLPIIIGGFEAQSIAIALEHEVKPSRPLTHDLFKSFAERFKIHVKQVIIHKLVDGVFYASLICERDQIEEIIDSRTSDAISLALRFNAPIFAHESVLEKAAVMIDDKDLDKDAEDNSNNTDDLQQLSVDELEKLIQKALKKEEYELAVKIRDEIAKRESKP